MPAFRARSCPFAYPLEVHTSLILLGFGIAALSPLLTFAHLWQIKEWRMDRLFNHLRSEGMLRQLLGVIRPPVVIASSILAALHLLSPAMASTLAIAILAGVAASQFALRRQPMPVWTSKGKMLTGVALLLLMTAGTIIAFCPAPASPLILPLLVLLAPLFLMLAWTLLLPLDTFLKQRILNGARRLRLAHPEITVIGVTGSMGKTTTKELLACAL